MNKNRIGILDGFRAIAILSVILFHFFSRWLPPYSDHAYYPYNDQYNFFKTGYYGVMFFFIISGFVIFFTLDNTKSFKSFWQKRFMRLLPSMLIASLVTLAFFRLFDHEGLFMQSHRVDNLFTSVTFISPRLYNHLSNTNHFEYLSGSYWSLWVEIQFYLFVSILYFFNRRSFVRNFIVTSSAIVLINYVFRHIEGGNALHIPLSQGIIAMYSTWVFNIFNLPDHLAFFSIGVLFYILFKSRAGATSASMLVKCTLAALLVFELYTAGAQEVRCAYLIMFLLFFGFIYFPQKLKIFETKLFTAIGVSSYFLYLVHEHIGVYLIHSWSKYFMPAGFICAILVIAFLIIGSWLYTDKIERRISKLMKTLMEAEFILRPLQPIKTFNKKDRN